MRVDTMSQYRIWLAGFFERWPEADNGSGPGAWRAFRYIDGGIWFAQDNEDYTICAKDKCTVCGGSGTSYCDGYCDAFHSDGCAGVKRYSVNGDCPSMCRICDGRGYVFVPSRINQG